MSATPTSSLAFQNFFSTTLSSDITASATDIPLDDIPNGSQGFLVIDPDTAANREVIFYTSKTATKVVCPSAADGRGQDDTSASSHLQGTSVIMAPIAAFYEALQSGAAISDAAINPRHWANSYKFRAYLNSAQNTGAASFAIINFDAENYDSNNNFSTSTHQYTAPVDGYYLFSYTVGITVAASETYEIALYVNGAIQSRGERDNVNTVEVSKSATDLVHLTAGDTVEVRASSANARALVTGSSKTHFSGFLVSRT